MKGEKTWLGFYSKDKAGLQSRQRVQDFAGARGIKNGQSRLMSRYVLVLPLGQTASELLSQQCLARWRTKSDPGASELRSEERNGKQALKKQD